MKLSNYKTIVFDCDGVLLNSNHIKSEAFYKVALQYGENFAEELLAYHKENGGISRFEKFRYFFSSIIGETTDEYQIIKLIEAYGNIVRQQLLSCDETIGMQKFMRGLPLSIKRIVVSGGMQKELREVFVKRGFQVYFDAIYGSPDTKTEILNREIKNGLITRPVAFLGDSRLDYEVASEFKFDFIFISDYTEFANWQDFFKDKRVNVFKNLKELANMQK